MLDMTTKARPPCFKFEKRAVEDREASRAAEAVIMKDEDWVVVRQLGSKDETEFPAQQWIDQMEKCSRDRPNDMPSSWVRGFKETFAAWKRGEEGQVDGTNIKNWPAATPAEIKNCERVGLRSVEDVAFMNEECMRMLGLGSRILKNKAMAFVEARTDPQVAVAARMDDLRTRNDSLELTVKEQASQLAALRAQVDALSSDQPVTSGKRRAG